MKVLFTALKYKKALTAIFKENLRFQPLQMNYKNSQKRLTEKERLRLVISSNKGPVVENIESDVATSKIVTVTVEKKTINFSFSPYCTLLFSRKENIKFFEVALVTVHTNCLISYLMIA